MRSTKSVKKVLEVFQKSDEAQSVVNLVKQFSNEMNKTTVYRILERLEKEGVLHSFSGVHGLRWFAKSNHKNHKLHMDNHSHFQCQICGKSECLNVPVDIPELPHHKVNATNLILVGQCQDCIK